MIPVAAAAKESCGARALLPLCLVALAPPLLIWAGIVTAPVFFPQAHFLCFHYLVEIVAVVAAALVFATGYHILDGQRPTASIMLACAFLGVGVLDLLHLLSYPDMPDFITPNNPQKALLIWLGARLLAAGALLAYVLLVTNPPGQGPPRRILLLFSLGYVALWGWLGFARPDLLPATFIPGQGYTPFKLGVEGVVVLIHLITLAHLARQRQEMPGSLRLLAPVLLLLIGSSLFFSLHGQLADQFNLLGHTYKMLAYLLIYRGMFLESVRQPMLRLETARDDLEQARTELAAIYENAPMVMMLVDQERRIRKANVPAQLFAGVDEAELVGRRPGEALGCLNAFAEGEAPGCGFGARCEQCVVRRLVLETLEQGTRHHQVEVALPFLIQGRPRELFFLLSATRLQIKGEYFVLVSLQEISERKALESQLAQARKMESIGVMAGGIAHDFNNILTPIMVHSELARLEVPDNGVAQQSLIQVQLAAERARALVRQILDFSRQGEHAPRPVRMGQMIREALKFLRAAIPSTIEITYEPRTERDTVVADPTQMLQVLMNLAANAAHAMRGRGGRISITLAEAAAEQLPFAPAPGLPYLKVTIQDTGEGIAPEILDRVADPYFTTKAKGEGTGMGLAVVHGIMEKHGGGLTIRSTVGQGTLVELFLPLSDQAIPAPTDLNQELPGGDERILLVDDEAAVVAAVAPILSKLGYRVTSKTSSVEALTLFRADPDRFDLLITDQSMPGLTGIILAGEVLRLMPGFPVIICTGFSAGLDENSARQAGIAALIMKPFAMHELTATIRRILA